MDLKVSSESIYIVLKDIPSKNSLIEFQCLYEKDITFGHSDRHCGDGMTRILKIVKVFEMGIGKAMYDHTTFAFKPTPSGSTHPCGL